MFNGEIENYTLGDYIDHFTTLDNDTLVFMLSIFGKNDKAIKAIHIVLKARGGNHNRNLVAIAPISLN